MADGTQVSQSAPPSELTLHVGEREIVPLTSAGAVGYGWRLTVRGDAQAVEAATGPEQPRAADAPPGGSLQQALFVSAVSPGRATIRLELLRFDRPPARELHEITVTVLP
jgi:hypothetical protein